MSGLKKHSEILETAAAQLMAAALDSGADAAEVCGGYAQRTRISMEKQDFHLAASDEGFSLGVRTLRGKKQGFASCNTTDPKELREVAARAVEIASLSPENPLWTIAASALVPNEAPTGMWDDKLHHVSLQTQKEWAERMVGEATKDARFRLNEGSVGVSSGISLVINSRGTHKIDHETAAHWSLMGMAVEGDNITSFDYFSEVSRQAQPVAERIVGSTRAFRERLIENLHQQSTQSYQGLVAFSPRAVIDIFLSGLSYHFNGRNLAEGTTKWKAADRGTVVLHPGLSVADRPWLTDRAGCSLFDREGTPTRDLPLIRAGKIENWMLDQYAASALKWPSTGHAAGGPTALPSVGSHCLCMAGGTEKLAALHARAAQKQSGVLLVQRYSGQSDPVTGDFSGVAKGGEWWEGGKKVRCVKETLLSGNLFDALGKNLFGISQETSVVDASEEAPTVFCTGISVTAQ